MTWSVAVAVIAFAVLGVAVFVAVRPCDLTVDFARRLGGSTTHSLKVSGTCDAAASTAWHDGDKDRLALWAVTVGTNQMGYTPAFGKSVKYTLLDGDAQGAFPGPYCVGEARHRLIWSGTLLTIALAIVTVGVCVARRPAREASGGDAFQI
jgi:hypothetical protein